MSKGILVLGAGGHASVCIEVFKEAGTNVAFCIDSANSEALGKKIHDIEVLSEADLTKLFDSGYQKAIIAIGDNSKRSFAQKSLSSLGFTFENAISRSAIISNSAHIGVGVAIMPGVIINSKAKIGNHCILNSGAVIEHDCDVSDFVHIAPNSTLTGNVKIGTKSLVGAGSVIIPGISIGSDVIIGAGSVVVNDIDSNATAFGNPAKQK